MFGIKKILSNLFLVNIIAILGLAILSYIWSSTIIRKTDEYVYYDYSNEMVELMNIKMNGLKEAVINLAQDKHILNILKSNESKEAKEEAIQEEIKIAKSILTVTSFSDNISIVDSRENTIYSTNGLYDGYAMFDKPWYKKMYDSYKDGDSDKFIMTEVHKGFLAGRECVAIASFIKDNDGNIIGCVVLNVYLDDMINHIKNLYINGDLNIYIDIGQGDYYKKGVGIVKAKDLKFNKNKSFVIKNKQFIFEFNREGSLFNKGIANINELNGIIIVCIIGIIIALLIYMKKEIFAPLILNVNKLKNLLKQLNKYDVSLENKKEVDQLETMVDIFNDFIDESAKKYIYYDSLTKLPNRKELTRLCDKLIERKNPFALIFIDINKFKNINDVYGHVVGDEFLVEFSNIVSKAVEGRANLIRISGDEFILLYKDYKSNKELENFYKEKVVKLFTYKKIVNNKFSVSFSAGVAVYPKDGESLVDLIKKSDYMMYTNKKNLVVNKLAFFDHKVYKELERRELINAKLKEALKNNEFEMYYQPIIDKNKKIKKLEALIRWQSKDLGFVSPIEFIEIAEKNRDIIDIGYWCIDRVSRDINEIKILCNKHDLKVNINISPIQLMQKGFGERMKRILDENRTRYESMIIEITESVILDEDEVALENLRLLNSLGIRVSLDDFGTGYTSFSYLKKFHGDSLKIDKTLIDDAKEKEYGIVNSIKEIGHELGFKVIVEGVETEEQFLILSNMGCDLFQGYYFSKPITLENIKKLINNN